MGPRHSLRNIEDLAPRDNANRLKISQDRHSGTITGHKTWVPGAGREDAGGCGNRYDPAP